MAKLPWYLKFKSETRNNDGIKITISINRYWLFYIRMKQGLFNSFRIMSL